MEFYDKKIETMSRKDIYKFQEDHFLKAFKNLYKNCELYREKINALNLKVSDIKSLKDISKLPIIMKDDLRNSKMNWSVPKEKVVNLHRSSGTTGKPTNIPYTKKDMDLWANFMARSLACVGIDKNSVIQNAYSYGLKTGGIGVHVGGVKIGALVIPASICGDVENVKILTDEQLKPDVICSTPSYAQYLAEYMEKYQKENNVDVLKKLNLKTAILGAEPWSDNTRKIIEDKLHIDAYDIYGLSEILGPGVAIECKQKQGLHIWEDLVYPEILDPKTFEPVKEGEVGTLVLTCLQKEGYPLIRYNTADLCSITYEKCKCGRTHARISRVKDRGDDMQIIRGVNVYPSQVEGCINKIVTKFNNDLAFVYEIIVDNSQILNRMIVKIEKNVSSLLTNFDNIKKMLETEFKGDIGIKIEVEIVEPNTLARYKEKRVRVKKQS